MGSSGSTAITAAVDAAVAALVASAPAALNTLDELAAALGDDASFATTVTNALAAKLALGGGTMSGELVLADQLLTRALLKDTGEENQALGALGTTETVNLTLGNAFTGTLDENVTITLSNPTASGDLCSFFALLTHDGSGGSTIAFTNGSWLSLDGTDPVLSTTAGATLAISGFTVNGGTTWYLVYGGCTA